MESISVKIGHGGKETLILLKKKVCEICSRIEFEWRRQIRVGEFIHKGFMCWLRHHSVRQDITCRLQLKSRWSSSKKYDCVFFWRTAHIKVEKSREIGCIGSSEDVFSSPWHGDDMGTHVAERRDERQSSCLRSRKHRTKHGCLVQG